MTENTLSVMEEKIFQKEKAELESRLSKVGEDLMKAFEPYGTLTGQFGEALRNYVLSCLVRYNEQYFGGYTTRALVSTNTSNMPQELKKAILEYATTEFLGKIEDLQNTLEQVYD